MVSRASAHRLDRRSSPFAPRTRLADFLSSPTRFFGQQSYQIFLHIRTGLSHDSHRENLIRVVCISDTHCKIQPNIPQGDLLIHAGDLTNRGTIAELQAQLDWLHGLDFVHVVVIAGNHDSYFDPKSQLAEDRGGKLRLGRIHYLADSSTTLNFPQACNRQLCVYGNPNIERCGDDSFAFQYAKDDSAAVWGGRVPTISDIVVTHSPPASHLDLPTGLGDGTLLREIWRARPRLHVFGHIHAAPGSELAYFDCCQVVYEHICSRTRRGLLELLDPWSWILLISLWATGLLVVANRLLLLDRQPKTRLVNAALSVSNTGRLGNPVQVYSI